MTGPLDGLRVIDLTTVVMGPFATQLMAEMGADVIKVEAPGGDALRDAGRSRNPGMSALFLQANQGKRSIVLDLKNAEDRETFLELLRSADVFITNIRSNALKRLRLAYSDVVKINARMIYCSLTGYGEQGRYHGKPAYDDLIQGAAALPSLYEQAGGTEPRYVPLTISDRIVGLYGLSTVLAALWGRERTGNGQAIEVPMFESMAHFVLADHMGGALFDPTAGSPGYQRLLSAYRKPHKTRDGYVCAMVYSDMQWQRFFEAIGKPELFQQDTRFQSLASRTTHIDEIYTFLSQEIATRTTDECLALFDRFDLPASRLNTLETLLEDPHLCETGFFQEVDHPTEGKLKVPTFPATFLDSQLTVARPAPKLDEDKTEILNELSKFGPEPVK
jgi:crotonobetainyl-CoA:carnitine CoA-transferase CaiB-like acyl-CoA transferase